MDTNYVLRPLFPLLAKAIGEHVKTLTSSTADLKRALATLAAIKPAEVRRT